MKRCLICILILAASVSSLYADKYIVTKEGKGIWATSAKQKGTDVIYVEKETGKSVTVALNKLDGVISQVTRGKKYTDEYINKQIDKLKKLIAKHRRVLLRPLNNLLQEWEMLMKPSADIEKGIPIIEGNFDKSKKDTDDFKTAHLELGMLKYKDMRNAYVKEIDSAMDRVEKEYIKISLEKLNKWASDPRLSMYLYLKTKKLGAELSDIVADPEKVKIAGMMDVAKRQVITYTITHVNNYFLKNKNVDGYLYGADLIMKMRDKVAVDEKDKVSSQKVLDDFIKKADKLLPGHTILPDGYPMTKEDMASVSNFKRYAYFVTFTNMDLNEEALFVPSENPGTVNISARDWLFNAKMFFNRAQPEGRTYGVKVMIQGETGSISEVVSFSTSPNIVNGRAESLCECHLNWVPDGYEIVPDINGQKSIYLTLVGQDSGSSGWTYLSKTCKVKAQ